MPVEMAHVREWFAQEHGGYIRFIEEMWEVLTKKFGRRCSIFCHIMYGWGNDGPWVHLGLWPMDEGADEALIVPIECLSEEEKRAAVYDTTVGPSDAPAEGGGEFDILSAADSLTYFASRDDVESCNINRALEFLVKLLEPRAAQRFKRRLLFGVSGYDADSRELYQIPEVRSWMRELDLVFPYWFYFLVREPSTMEFVRFRFAIT
jgi:hypothetical protein